MSSPSPARQCFHAKIRIRNVDTGSDQRIILKLTTPSFFTLTGKINIAEPFSFSVSGHCNMQQWQLFNIS